jgi:hypothetical protein
VKKLFFAIDSIGLASLALPILLASVFESIVTASTLPQAISTVTCQEACLNGERFLTNMVQPKLNLLPEYAGAKVAWLYHDNYLAAKLLARSHPELTVKIQAAIRSYGITNSGKIEILFDETPRPLPFHIPELVTIATNHGFHVRTEILTPRLQIGWQEYADLLLLAAWALRDSDPAQARLHYQSALAMWDGCGLVDRATRHARRYAVYKLALALLVARELKADLPMRKAMLDRLLSLQAPSGGWITDYDATGKPLGLANVETTCLALLALRAEVTARRNQTR